MNGHIIIPADRLRSEFIHGENLRFANGRIPTDIAAAALDVGASDYGAYSLMALIVSECPTDDFNVLLYWSNWAW